MGYKNITRTYVEIPLSSNNYTFVQNKGSMPIGITLALSLPDDDVVPNVIINQGEGVRFNHDGNYLYAIAISDNSAVSYNDR